MHPVVLEDLDAIAAAPLDWERLAGKTILITGAAGFLPACMVETLLRLNATRGLGCTVVGLVRNPDRARRRFVRYSDRADFQLLEGDVCDPPDLPARCDFVIHAASQASPKCFGTDPVGTMAANVLGTYHLLQCARSWQSENFLLFSSGEVYGRVAPGCVPTPEDGYGFIEIGDPRSCYAEGKRAAETLGASFHHQFGVPFNVVRPFHTYGPGMALDDGRVFADFVRDVVHGSDLIMHSDGSAVRAFCYVADAVAGFFTVLLRGAPGAAYNVGNPEGALSIAELAALLAGLDPGRGLRVVRAPRETPGYLESPIPANIPDIAKLRRLGWAPRHSPEEGFRRTLRTFLEPEPAAPA